MEFCPRTLATTVVAVLLDPQPKRLASRMLDAMADLTQGPQNGGEWNARLMQAQLYRGEELEDYLGDTVAPELAFLPLTNCQLLDAPPGFPNDMEGVHPYPLLNWLHDVMGQLGQGMIDRNDLEIVFNAIWQQFAEGMKVFGEDPDPFRGQRGQKLCRDIMGAVQQLNLYVEDGDSRALGQGMERFLIGCEELEAFFFETGAQAFESGPSGLAAFDWVIHAVLAYGDGLIGREVGEAAVEFSASRLRTTQPKFELAAALTLGTDPGFFHLVDEVADSLASSREQLERLESLLEDPEEREQACQHFIGTGQLVFELSGILERLAQREGDAPESELGFSRKLVTMGERVITEEAGLADLQPWMEQATFRLQRAERLLEGAPEEWRWAGPIEAGLEFYRLGIEGLEAYLEKGRLRVLSNGLRHFLDAATKLQKVREKLA